MNLGPPEPVSGVIIHNIFKKGKLGRYYIFFYKLSQYISRVKNMLLASTYFVIISGQGYTNGIVNCLIVTTRL